MLGIVTGLTAEARLARPLGVAVAGGGTTAGARRAAERLAVRGATTLLSFGLAGGLDPALPPGTLIIPGRVLTKGGILQANAALVAALGGNPATTLLASDRVVSKAADKMRLWTASGAAAVDMESGAVAEVAAERGLTFAVLRAVCDPAEQDLPPAALAALDADGAMALRGIALSVLRRPAQIPALLRLAQHARQGRAALVGKVRQVAVIAADPRF
jgi:adenosylhomocysteine nucleosidase